MLTVALALSASLSWGAADFLGGLKSRSLPILTVLAVSQAAGLATIALVVALRGKGPPGGEFALWAALAAVGGTSGLAAFYRGLSVGAMAIVAPISATGAALPVVFGLVTGESPSAAQLAGIALAIAGVVLASREEPPPDEATDSRRARTAAGVGLALLAAAGFGSFFILMGEASEGDALWAILVNRIAGASVLVGLALALGSRRPGNSAEAAQLALIGVLDMSANALYALATTEGLLSVAAVLASLYPVVVVALASLVLRERIRPGQRAGVVAALAGVALISAG